jgi:hypothetical protein
LVRVSYLVVLGPGYATSVASEKVSIESTFAKPLGSLPTCTRYPASSTRAVSSIQITICPHGHDTLMIREKNVCSARRWRRCHPTLPGARTYTQLGDGNLSARDDTNAYRWLHTGHEGRQRLQRVTSPYVKASWPCRISSAQPRFQGQSLGHRADPKSLNPCFRVVPSPCSSSIAKV